VPNNNNIKRRKPPEINYMIRTFFLFLLSICCLAISAQQVEAVASPDKNIHIEFAANGLVQNLDAPAYRVFYHAKPFLLTSRMGFEIAGQPIFTTGFKITDVVRKENRNNWKPVYGERDSYPDNYNEMTITLQEQLPPKRTLQVIFRAYDEGIAFRFVFFDIPAGKTFAITKEMTEFQFIGGTQVWEEHGHEGLYAKALASSIKPATELPLTVETPDSIYAVVAEGGSSDYPRAYVQPQNNQRSHDNSISIQLRGEAKGNNGYTSAWRMITLADRPGALIEQNYLLLNLNRPNAVGEISWIKPGKAIRDNTLSTEGGKKFIDYAQGHGIDYVILDWGWYGPPNGEASDPSYVNVVNPGTGKPIPNHPGLNIQELVAYGKTKGVGIWLYVNRQGLERYMDKIFPIYESWGIKGIKPGFINTGNQEWQQWVDTLISKAAAHHLMVDVHDAYRPTGLTRTYPNFMTQEGTRGNEHAPDADHNTTLPFTRYTIGPGDYTPGYCRTTLLNTWTHRLALPIVLYSPVQFLFWGEPLSDCHNRPELSLWRDMPTTWNDTKVVGGAIGEFIVVARRKDNDWYVGGITNHNARKIDVDLQFLHPQKRYLANIYKDNDEKTGVAIIKQEVTATTKLSFDLPASGGFAVQWKEK
jgi:alpha-glucosidase